MVLLKSKALDYENYVLCQLKIIGSMGRAHGFSNGKQKGTIAIRNLESWKHVSAINAE